MMMTIIIITHHHHLVTLVVSQVLPYFAMFLHTFRVNLHTLASSTDSRTGLTVRLQAPGGSVLTGSQDVGIPAQLYIQLDQTFGNSL